MVKGPAGYQLPADGVPPGDGAAVFERAARQWLLSATAAQNQAVLRTPPGRRGA